MEEGTVTIYVTVVLRCRAGCDAREVIEDLDYHFDHPAIIDTEILDSQVTDPDDFDSDGLLVDEP